jgi:hypothetical protein
MRLEDDVHARVVALEGGPERRPDFGRVMAVVVDDRDAVDAALDLESAVDAAEGRKLGLRLKKSRFTLQSAIPKPTGSSAKSSSRISGRYRRNA